MKPNVSDIHEVTSSLGECQLPPVVSSRSQLHFNGRYEELHSIHLLGEICSISITCMNSRKSSRRVGFIDWFLIVFGANRCPLSWSQLAFRKRSFSVTFHVFIYTQFKFPLFFEAEGSSVVFCCESTESGHSFMNCLAQVSAGKIGMHEFVVYSFHRILLFRLPGCFIYPFSFTFVFFVPSIHSPVMKIGKSSKVWEYLVFNIFVALEKNSLLCDSIVKDTGIFCLYIFPKVLTLFTLNSNFPFSLRRKATVSFFVQ